MLTELAMAIIGSLLPPAWVAAGLAEPVVPADHQALVRNGGQLLMAASPFTGYLKETWPGGAVKRLEHFRDGRLDGWSTTWYPSGRVEERRYWRQGRKHGVHTGYWEHGGQRFHYRFADGVYHGRCTDWYDNGQRAAVRHFEAGEEVGSQQSWTIDGDLFANYVVRGGRRYGLIGTKPCMTVYGEGGTP